ncbi:hypothetical protein CEUSTIGMA_g13482.t1 [Chlamydomonas eustigma]|uniref:SF3 helicase domain-containing protein n=1 Tax=Chlamydomonas eustigma TaxID=1157962 RepID=A0A250XSM9_9CHLO|nr:hypothetical protein CEUSTIGMA_g13482.t1 [Chlamydomonas eustigma]|eukprot:GAX86068.1 hypothetical protein CEUSTIGMA_g13482.t1 [Chlamydomonas eustigma]
MNNSKRKYKVSHRAYVTNYKIEYTLLPDVIVLSGRSDLFDTAVYKSKEQLLGMVGCTKTRQDPRLLAPELLNIDMASYVVQHLTGSELSFVLQPVVEDVPTPEEEMQSLSDCWTRYDTWSKIAMGLKNEYGDRFKSYFIELSRMAPNFDLDAAEKLRASVGNPEYSGRPLTFGTILKWCKLDDSEGYAAVKASAVPPYVLERFNKGDRGRAEIVASLLRREVKKVGKNDYYVFESGPNVWRKVTRDGIQMRVSHMLEEAMHDVQVYYKFRALSPALEEDQRKVFQDLSVLAGKFSVSALTYSTIIHTTSLVGPLLEDPHFVDKLDSHPHLLGVQNGVVDLRGGTLRAREPEDYIYNLTTCAYDGSLDTSEVSALILQIMAGDEDMVSFVQKLLGYGITGEVSEEIFVLFNGTGRNGKGVITQTLQNILGRDLVKDMDVALICGDVKNLSNVSAELANKIAGCRIALFKESKHDEVLKTNTVQLLSGGDLIPCRRLYTDAESLTPRHLSILETNHLPSLSGEVIPAIVDRILVVHFPVTFKGDLLPGESWSALVQPADKTLKERLKGMHGAILTWLVQGSIAWYKERNLKSSAPEAVKEFTRRYMLAEDLMAQFIQEVCVVNPYDRVSSNELVQSFNEWKRFNSSCRKKVDNKSMATLMARKGFTKKNTRFGGIQMKGYEGIRVDKDKLQESLSEDVLGYGITGEVSEEIFVLFNGTGRNGKGVITQTLQNILGRDLVKDMDVALICGDVKNLSNVSAELANKIAGCRIALFKESKHDEVLKTNTVQLLSGGDLIPCRRLYTDAESLTPRHLSILETNHLPSLSGEVIPAIVDRILVVHFPVTFKGDLLPGESWSALVQPADKTLKERLKGMHGAILTWLVQGSIAWYKERNLKSSAPEAVKEFTRRYMLAEDLMAQFIQEVCVVNPYDRVSSNELVQSFNEWKRFNSSCRKKVDNKSMATLMARKGFTKKNTRFGGIQMKGYEGIRVDKDKLQESLSEDGLFN